MHCPYCKSEYKKDLLECPVCNTPLVQFPPNGGSSSHPSKYLNDMEEWSRNQYNPGYWTGGNIPPHIKILSKAGSKKIGKIALICGLILFGITIDSLLNINIGNSEELLATITSNIIRVFFGALLVWAGIQRVKESKNRKK